MIIPPIRGADSQGKGYFGAPRGDHTHKGVDFVATAGQPVKCFMAGTVSKLGYPYADKPEFRYVEIKRDNGDLCRYFYVAPIVHEGQRVTLGQIIGMCQLLPYAGITNHYHFEVKVAGEFVEPIKYLCENA